MTFLPSDSIAAAQQLAGIVHGDGGCEDVAALLRQVSTRRCSCDDHDTGLAALCVALAAMVDIERAPSDLLDWTQPRNRRAQRHADLTVVDDLAIERACRGEHVHLTQQERKLAVHRLCNDMEPGAIAYRLNMSTARVQQILRESTPASTPSRRGHDGGPRQAGVAPSSQTNRREAS